MKKQFWYGYLIFKGQSCMKNYQAQKESCFENGQYLMLMSLFGVEYFLLTLQKMLNLGLKMVRLRSVLSRKICKIFNNG